jgi:hypothetical protein
MVHLMRGLVTSWLVGLQLFKPGGNPLVFVTNALEMKGQDTLGIRHRDTCAGSTLSLIGQLLQAVEIVQASLYWLLSTSIRKIGSLKDSIWYFD